MKPKKGFDVRDIAAWLFVAIIFLGAGYAGGRFLRNRQADSLVITPPSKSGREPGMASSKESGKGSPKRVFEGFWFNMMDQDQLETEVGISREAAREIIRKREKEEGFDSFEDFIEICRLFAPDDQKAMAYQQEHQSEDGNSR